MAKKSKVRPFETKRYLKTDGTVMYIFNGSTHNWEGPAVIHPDGKTEYWIYGKKHTKDSWLEAKRDTNGIPPAKNPMFKTGL